jgi:Putative Actinobacterial Holin-X, holin superfamily III
VWPGTWFVLLSIGAWWGLSNVMDGGWAALIVAVAWAVVAAVLYMGGRSQLRAVRGLRRTVETVRDAFRGVKERVMGAASDVGDQADAATSAVGEATSSLADTA